VLAGVGLLVAISVGLLAVRWRTPEPIVIQPPPTPLPSSTPGPLHVYVSGAVLAPDVYELPYGSMVRDAVNAAGGALAEADLARINLAASLSDGAQVHVPAIGESPSTGSDEEIQTTPTPNYPININTASLEELDVLPGIGPALAQRIIDYRERYGPFASIESIQNVSGIGPSKFEDIRELITVGQP